MMYYFYCHSIIVADVEVCFAILAPSKEWFYVDKVIQQSEYVILVKRSRKQHAFSRDMDTESKPQRVSDGPYFLGSIICLFYWSS